MIAEDIRQQAGKKNKSGAWYVNALTEALSGVQNPDISASDTSGVTEGDLFFFSYSPSSQKDMNFGTLNPLQ